tara:strand:+ start:238 stop:558 length:321 start_codon:yes stop_codon:yes gene_type:complete
MNPVTDIFFILTWFALLVFAIRLIARGWSKPVGNYNADTWTTKVTKRIHPEMVDVEPGEKLMGVTFGDPKDIDNYSELQKRINELQSKLEDDEDDDEGGTGVLTNA